MTRERVNAMLAGHLERVGRRGHIAAEIEEAEREVQREKAGYEWDLIGPKVSRITGEPGCGLQGRSTEGAALELADAAAFRESEYGARAEALEARIAALRAELEDIELEIRYVDAGLGGLTRKERFAISEHIIRQATWFEVEPLYVKEFGVEVCRDTLKRAQKAGLEKIYGMAR